MAEVRLGYEEKQNEIQELLNALSKKENENLRLQEQVEKQDGVQAEIERKFIELTTVTDNSIKSKQKHLDRKDKLIEKMQAKSDKMVQQYNLLEEELLAVRAENDDMAHKLFNQESSVIQIEDSSHAYNNDSVLTSPFKPE